MFTVMGQHGADALGQMPMLWSTALMSTLMSVVVSDILWRRVSNNIVFVTWILGLAFWSINFGFEGLLASLSATLLALAFGSALWGKNLIGAADAKVLAAYSAWVGVACLFHLVLYGAIFAGILGAVALLDYGPGNFGKVAEACLDPKDALTRARNDGSTMPLTVALSASIYVILWGGA